MQANDAFDVFGKAYNKGFVLRNPIITETPTAFVMFTDQYTTVDLVNVHYYKTVKPFNIINSSDTGNVLNYC